MPSSLITNAPAARRVPARDGRVALAPMSPKVISTEETERVPMTTSTEETYEFRALRERKVLASRRLSAAQEAHREASEELITTVISAGTAIDHASKFGEVVAAVTDVAAAKVEQAHASYERSAAALRDAELAAELHATNFERASIRLQAAAARETMALEQLYRD
jgi:hypothetical protein